jgi:predicted TIM-barrel fold metal-dependent hydrolase
MFGTDWPYLENFMNQKMWVEWIQNIPEKVQEYGLKFKQREIKNILYRNAEQFLQFK